jgi:hypothetical protein
LRKMGWEVLPYHEVFGWNLIDLHGVHHGTQGGSVGARFKGETGREEGDVPFGVFQIHMVPDRDRGLIIETILRRGKRWELPKEESIYRPLPKTLKR